MLEGMGERPGGIPVAVFRFARAGIREHERYCPHMTDSLNSGEALSPKEALEIAENHIGRALKALDEHIRNLKEESIEGVPGLNKALGEAHKAVQAFLDERTRFEKFSEKVSGGRGGGGLDLDKARDEIWRRLACLSDAADAGGVSGGVDG